jgi:hypothetical protein
MYNIAYFLAYYKTLQLNEMQSLRKNYVEYTHQVAGLQNALAYCCETDYLKVENALALT